METIFDHNVTSKELEQVLGLDTFTPADMMEFSQEENFGIIYSLYAYRGDQKMMQRYADKIAPSAWKFYQLTNHDTAYRTWRNRR